MQCFRSREYGNDKNDNNDDEEKENSDTVYVIRLKRLEGTPLNFGRVKRATIFERCSSVLTGLPHNILRARKLKAIENREKGLHMDDLFNNLTDDENDEEEDDDYDEILKQDNNNINDNNQVAVAAQ